MKIIILALLVVCIMSYMTYEYSKESLNNALVTYKEVTGNDWYEHQKYLSLIDTNFTNNVSINELNNNPLCDIIDPKKVTSYSPYSIFDNYGVFDNAWECKSGSVKFYVYLNRTRGNVVLVEEMVGHK